MHTCRYTTTRKRTQLVRPPTAGAAAAAAAVSRTCSFCLRASSSRCSVKELYWSRALRFTWPYCDSSEATSPRRRRSSCRGTGACGGASCVQKACQRGVHAGQARRQPRPDKAVGDGRGDGGSAATRPQGGAGLEAEGDRFWAKKGHARWVERTGSAHVCSLSPTPTKPLTTLYMHRHTTDTSSSPSQTFPEGPGAGFPRLGPAPCCFRFAPNLSGTTAPAPQKARFL